MVDAGGDREPQGHARREGRRKAAVRAPEGQAALRFARTSNSLGWDIYFARETPLPDGGRKIDLASKLIFNPKTNTMEIENWDNEPVRLNEITVIEPKEKK